MSLSGFEKTLLHSATRDAPSTDRRRAARTATLRAAGVLARSPTLPPSTTTARATPVWSLGKLAIVLGLGIGAISAAIVAAPPGPTPSSRGVTSSGVTGAPSTVHSTEVASERPIPTLDVSTISNVSKPPGVKLVQSHTSAPPLTEDEVGVEARLLDAARRCITSGDLVCARTRLAEHDARFSKRGVLANEATLLAIDLALADRKRGEARALARDLIARQPRGGTWSPRIKKLAEESE